MVLSVASCLQHGKPMRRHVVLLWVDGDIEFCPVVDLRNC